MGFENGKLVRATIRADSGPNVMENVLHYDLNDGTGLGEPNDPQELANRLSADVVPAYRALFNNTWTIQPVVVAEELDPTNKLRARKEWVAGTPLAGTKVPAAEIVAYGIAAVCTLLTTHIGRRARGRMFIGGSWDESDVSGNAFVTGTGHWDSVIAYVASIPRQPDLALGTSDAVCNWCVYSRTQRADNGPDYAPRITATSLKTSIHFLRRRMPGN